VHIACSQITKNNFKVPPISRQFNIRSSKTVCARDMMSVPDSEKGEDRFNFLLQANTAWWKLIGILWRHRRGACTAGVKKSRFAKSPFLEAYLWLANYHESIL